MILQIKKTLSVRLCGKLKARAGWNSKSKSFRFFFSNCCCITLAYYTVSHLSVWLHFLTAFHLRQWLRGGDAPLSALDDSVDHWFHQHFSSARSDNGADWEKPQCAAVRAQIHFIQTEGICTVLTFFEPQSTLPSKTRSTLPNAALVYGGGRVLCLRMHAFITHNTVWRLITLSRARKWSIMTEVTCY